MLVSIAICLAALILTISLVRNGRPTLGLPVGYLFLLLLIHLPGAVAHLMPNSHLQHKGFTETGIRYTAIGCLAFAGGLALARWRRAAQPMALLHPGRDFLKFCLVGGWVVTFVLRPFLVRVPSLGAAIDFGGRLWVLAALLALPWCFRRRHWKAFLVWTAIVLIYPFVGLIKGGFLSYGTTTTVLAFSLMVVAVRSWWKLMAGVTVVSVMGMSLFVTYFSVRDDIRRSVWGKEDFDEVLNQSGRLFREFHSFDAENEKHLEALNQRLNQNVFVGMAAARLQRGVVDYYHGRTLWEGVLSVVPRAVWPNKPVFGGSPKIINEMTDFVVNKSTSFGVGNVMEFYINFGLPSLILGFVVLGWTLGKLDRVAANALFDGCYPRLIGIFLPAVAMIRPGESTVEMVGGAVAALVASWAWGWGWRAFVRKRGLPGGLPPEAVDSLVPAPRSPQATLDGVSAKNVIPGEGFDWEQQQRDEFRF